MEEYVELKMLFEKSFADELLQKGMAEIVPRRADAKYRSFVKSQVLGKVVPGEEIPQRVAKAAMQLSIPETSNMENVRGALRVFEKGIGNQVNALTTTTKNMALNVDRIYQLTSSVKSLSYLNTGISLANLAVNVAGFLVMNGKINALNSEVQLVANYLSKTANVQKNGKISTCQKLIMRFNSMSAKIQSGDVIDLDVLEYLIIDMRAYISEMVLNLHDEALGTELVLKIIYSLLPAYTLLFGEFTKLYYYEKHCLPANYDMFLNLYDELEGVNFRGKLHDYYFIDQKMHSQDVLDILNAHTLLGLNGKVQIEDQTALLQILKTRDRVEQFDKGLDTLVHSWVKERIPIIAKKSGVSEKECLKLFVSNKSGHDEG